jgi:hypothetical protein
MTLRLPVKSIPVVEVRYVAVGAGLGSELLLGLMLENKIANITLLPDCKKTDFSSAKRD